MAAGSATYHRRPRSTLVRRCWRRKQASMTRNATGGVTSSTATISPSVFIRDFRRGLQRLEEDRPWPRCIVMLSSGTDCYQDRRAAQITRGCIQELIEHDIPVRILSRSPNLTRDIDLFKKAGDRIAVGTSIPTFDASLVNALEPNAPPPQARWEALDQLFQAGVPPVRVFLRRRTRRCLEEKFVKLSAGSLQ